MTTIEASDRPETAAERYASLTSAAEERVARSETEPRSLLSVAREQNARGVLCYVARMRNDGGPEAFYKRESTAEKVAHHAADTVPATTDAEARGASEHVMWAFSQGCDGHLLSDGALGTL